MVRDDDVYLPEILFELRPQGRYMRVSAIDPITGIEAVSICDKTYSQSMMKRLGARKLKYVLRKRRAQDGGIRPLSRRGIIA